MSYKPDEKDWMAYLYGELEPEEKLKFERYLSTHPEAGRILAEYRDLRTMLDGIGDKEVIAPPIFVSSSESAQRKGYFWDAPYVKTIATIAASLLIIILAGKVADVQLVVSPRTFTLSFGPTEVAREEQPEAAALSAQQVQKMIDASLDQTNATVKEQLGETQKKIESSIRTILAQNRGRTDQLAMEAATASQAQIRDYVETIRAENMEQVKAYFQLTSTEQKQYIENLLVDFSKYLQQQRNNDLQLVQTRMKSLEQNTDLFRQETEQILSSIITTVGNPATREIKN